MPESSRAELLANRVHHTGVLILISVAVSINSLKPGLDSSAARAAGLLVWAKS